MSRGRSSEAAADRARSLSDRNDLPAASEISQRDFARQPLHINGPTSFTCLTCPNYPFAVQQFQLISESNPPPFHVRVPLKSPFSVYWRLPLIVKVEVQGPLTETFPLSACTVSFMVAVGSPVSAIRYFV